MSNNFWVNNTEILISDWSSFFPDSKLNEIDNLNTLVRFGIYSSLLLALYHGNMNYLFLMIIPLVFSYVLYMYLGLEKFENINISDYIDNLENNYTLPTLNNPMMNILPGDSPDKPPAYPINENSEEAYIIKKDMENKLNFNVFSGIEDIYNNKHSQREFYTMPVTTVPNDREKFIDFVYKNDYKPTCKENRFYCLKDPDIKPDSLFLYNNE